MVRNLDLEEQEQLDQLKHFWRQYGNLITWGLTLVLGVFAAYNGWNFWQQRQGQQAAALYDELERANKANDIAKLQRALDDMKERHGSATLTAQAALLVAKTYYDQGKTEPAQNTLTWVTQNAKDPGLQALARLRLASLLLQAKAYDQALEQLAGTWPEPLAGLAHDRRGDVYMLQNKKTEARAEYEKAYAGIDSRSEYRRMVEVKLNALGVEPKPTAPATPAASEGVRS